MFALKFNCLPHFTAESTTIHLKVAKVQPEPGRVEDYHVPVVIYPDILTEYTISLWDLTTQQVIFSRLCKRAYKVNLFNRYLGISMG